jgi:hypothetical protein
MQAKSELIIHPIDLSEFGKNPAGNPIYRVVWGPSRTEKVLIKSRNELAELKRYPNQECWILEKWQSALDWAGPRDSHEERCAKSHIAMDYPEDGEYEQCDGAFPDQESVFGFARLFVHFLVMGKVNYTEKERQRALKLREQIKEDDLDQKTSDAISDVLSTPTWAGKRVKLYDAAGNMI